MYVDAIYTPRKISLRKKKKGEGNEKASIYMWERVSEKHNGNMVERHHYTGGIIEEKQVVYGEYCVFLHQ